jgi:prophage antirepressor-like protein
VASQVNELGKAELAKYVTHRRTILDLVLQSLKRVRADDKYPFEKILHKMIFPMGETSRDIFFEQQNLWIIDERLCYHTILTSDKKT